MQTGLFVIRFRSLSLASCGHWYKCYTVALVGTRCAAQYCTGSSLGAVYTISKQRGCDGCSETKVESLKKRLA